MPGIFQATTDSLEQCWNTMLQDPKSTLQALNGLVETFKDDDPCYDTALFYRGCCMIYIGDYREAIQQLQTALSRAERKDDVHQIRRVSNSLGMAYKSIGEYGSALKALDTSVAISKRANYAYGQIVAQLNLADLFYDAQDYDMCELYINELMGLDHSDCDEEIISELHFHQAKIFLLHFEFDNASRSLDKALEVGYRIKYIHLTINGLILKGRILRLKGDLSGAETVLEDVINDPDFELEGSTGLSAYVELAKALISAEKFSKALTIINAALDIKNISNDHSLLRLQISQLAAVCYQQSGDFKSALAHLTTTLEMERSLVNQRNKRALELGKARLQAENERIKQEITERENAYLKNAQNQLKVINNFAIELAATLDMATLAERLYVLLHEFLDAHFVALSENDPENECITFRAIIDDGKSQPLYSINYSDQGSRTVKAATTRNIVSTGEDITRKRIGKSDLVPNSQLFLPLLNKDEVIGVLSIQSMIKDRFDGDEFNLILAIAPFISLAFNNALSHEKLQKLNSILVNDKKEIISAQEKIQFLALHDSLTELPNRRALNQHIEAVTTGLSNDTPFSLAYIDLDGFKPINDQYGHQVGDRVLQIVAERINTVLRKSDFCARVGGDEFVLIIDHIEDKQQLHAMTERILSSIEQPISVEKQILALSASIGVVEYLKHGDTLDALIHRADQAMYHVKRKGKGGIYIAK